MRVLLVALVTWTCARPPAVSLPRIRYYDTRSLVNTVVDSTMTTAVLRGLKAALPNEVGFCLYGQIDEILPTPPRRRAVVTRVTIAEQLWADSFRVARDTAPVSGCEPSDGVDPLVAIGHTHPYSGLPCPHSGADAYVLASDPRLLMSFVFCGDGSGEILWQDGRTILFLWARS